MAVQDWPANGGRCKKRYYAISEAGRYMASREGWIVFPHLNPVKADDGSVIRYAQTVGGDDFHGAYCRNVGKGERSRHVMVLGIQLFHRLKKLG